MSLREDFLLRLCPDEVRFARMAPPPICPLCLSRESVPLCIARDRTTVAALCGQCGLYFTSGPALEGRPYQGGFWTEEQQALAGTQTDFRAAERAEHLARSLGRSLQGLTVLEIGAGRGEYCVELARRGARVMALEPDAVMANRLAERAGIEARACLAEQFDPCGRRFDVVNLSHVLEHAPDPIAMLARARGWLAVGGVVGLEVPNADVLAGGRLQSFFFDETTHCYHFTLEALERLARAAGLELFGTEEAVSEHWGPRAALRCLARPGTRQQLARPDRAVLRRARLKPLEAQAAWRLWRGPLRMLRHAVAPVVKTLLPTFLVAKARARLDRNRLGSRR